VVVVTGGADFELVLVLVLALALALALVLVWLVLVWFCSMGTTLATPLVFHRYLIFIQQNVHNMVPTISKGKALIGCLLPMCYLVNIRTLSDLGIFSLMVGSLLF
jgi:hypothetical protein